jgi:hypothetical protein
MYGRIVVVRDAIERLNALILGAEKGAYGTEACFDIAPDPFAP